jgi:RNA recognition motif-containing protein
VCSPATDWACVHLVILNSIFFFYVCGIRTIEYADVLTRNDGKSSGGGLVRYSSAREAQKAIKELTDTKLKGRLIFVREDREAGGKRGGSGGKGRDEVTVFVGNIPFHTQWQTIKDLFSEFGVTHADCGESRNGRMRGYALIKFKNMRDAEAAIKAMDGHMLEGRDLEVRLDNK